MVATALSEPASREPTADADVLELVADVEELDPHELKLAREVWKKYGDDFGRRLADLEAGRHPYQQPR